jgi:hypothetical protein
MDGIERVARALLEAASSLVAVDESEARQVLEEVRAVLGRNYKSAVRSAWMNGDYEAQGLSKWASRLQQIRNQYGPSWLVRASEMGGTSMDRKMIASELLAVAKELMATDFPTQDAMDKYLKDHPDADRSNHRVVEDKKDVERKIRETPDQVEERLKKQMGDKYKTQEERTREQKDKWDKLIRKGSEWMTAAEVGTYCRACEEKMLAKGLTKVKRSFFEEALRKASEGAGS